MTHTQMLHQGAAGRPLQAAAAPALGRHQPGDPLSREVYCILGVPVDLVTMPAVLARIQAAAADRAPFLLSTPNLNFLVMSQSDAAFRETLLASDLCPPDGAPIVWIARLLGVPITARTAGSDILEALKRIAGLRLFFMGGADGVAAAALNAFNSTQGGARCVGTLNPGFRPIEEMSGEDVIGEINASGADFLVASLGARKGQLWLHRNCARLAVPVRAHLGAALNFQAGTVKRAPALMREAGLEWLWRIKEEPRLFTRYLNDGIALLRLVLTRVLPLAALAWRQRARARQGLTIAPSLAIAPGPATAQAARCDFVTVRLGGSATAENVGGAIAVLREAAAAQKALTLDLSAVRDIDARFLGLLLMLRKTLTGRGTALALTGLSPRLARVFRLSGAGDLLPECS